MLTHPHGLHLWLPLPGDRTEEGFVAQARLQGVAIAPGASFRISDAPWQPAVRISLGSTTEAELRAGLGVVCQVCCLAIRSSCCSQFRRRCPANRQIEKYCHDIIFSIDMISIAFPSLGHGFSGNGRTAWPSRSSRSTAFQRASAPSRCSTGCRWRCMPGEKLALIGPSGSGKTTILRILMTLERIDGGHIQIDGEATLPHAAQRPAGAGRRAPPDQDAPEDRHGLPAVQSVPAQMRASTTSRWRRC